MTDEFYKRRLAEVQLYWMIVDPSVASKVSIKFIKEYTVPSLAKSTTEAMVKFLCRREAR